MKKQKKKDQEINKENQKKYLWLILGLIILVILGSGYFLFVNKNNKDEEDNNTTQETKEKNELINIEKGEKVVWENEQINFYLPKNWTFKTKTNEDLTESITIEGDNLLLSMNFLEVEKDYLWSNQKNIEYETSTSRLYKKDNYYEGVFNSSTTVTEENFETGEKTTKYYNLFLTIEENGEKISSLSSDKLNKVKFILDSYNEENSL